MNEAFKQRMAIAAASVLLVLAVIGVAVRAGDDEDTVALPSPSASARETDGPDATKTPARRTTAPSTASAAPASAAPTTAPDDDVQPDAAVPPKSGTYRYKQTRNDQRTESTLEITSIGSRRYREASDDGFTNESVWRKDGKFLEKTTFGQQPNSFDCVWDPPIRELELPLAKGSSWEIRGTCAAGPGITITFDGETEVTGAARVTVGRTPVDVWLMRTEVTLTSKAPQGSVDQTVTSDDQFAPEYGVYVRSVEESSGTDPRTGQDVKQRSVQELISLTPA